MRYNNLDSFYLSQINKTVYNLDNNVTDRKMPDKSIAHKTKLQE